MAKSGNFLALDLGAESGRAIVGSLKDQHLSLSEVHRFSNVHVRLPDGWHWDTLRLWTDIKEGIRKGVEATDGDLLSVGIDTWGVDFGLFDRHDALVGPPYMYRDSRTDGAIDAAEKLVPRQEIFERTGIQFLQLNSLFQLFSMIKNEVPALGIAETFLTMPDLFNFWLTGRKVIEFSFATTTMCYDPRASDWARPMLEKLGIPTHIFPEVVPSGTVLGKLLPEVAEEVGINDLTVVAPASHDTGSAVVGVPAQGDRFAWISSGTWSILGAELTQPVITSKGMAANLTNEGGMNHTFRFCRNIMGLWLIQQCRRTWLLQGEDLSYSEITRLAAESEPLRSLIDPDCSDFFSPGDMPSRIQAYCQRTGQPVPETKGAIVRCALDSLALKYRWVLDRIEECLGYRLDPLHIVGGGTKNELLSQLTATSIGRQVVTGPIEATASGNIVVQAMAMGYLDSLEEGRQVVRNSFPTVTFEPKDRSGWDEAYDHLLELMP